LEGFTALAIGSNDEHGIITGDGAGNFRKFSSIHSGRERLRAAGRSFEDQKIFRGTNIEKEFAEGAGQRGHGRNVLRHSGGGTITLAGLDEFELMQVARKGSLSNPHALLREAAAEIFLIGNTLGRNQAKDLAMTECFRSAHFCDIHSTVYLYNPPECMSNIFGISFAHSTEVAA